jgi:hypothetical protein
VGDAHLQRLQASHQRRLLRRRLGVQCHQRTVVRLQINARGVGNAARERPCPMAHSPRLTHGGAAHGTLTQAHSRRCRPTPAPLRREPFTGRHPPPLIIVPAHGTLTQAHSRRCRPTPAPLRREPFTGRHPPPLIIAGAHRTPACGASPCPRPPTRSTPAPCASSRPAPP